MALIETLIILSIAVAGITHSWMSGSLFLSLRRFFANNIENKNIIIRTVSRGAICHFCVSHWFAIVFGIGLFLIPNNTYIIMIVFASVFIASQLLILFTIITDRLPRLIDSKLSNRYSSNKAA